MDLQISFEPLISESTVSRLIMTVGNASVSSYPMSVEDHYRDLFAIKYFLRHGKLTTIMLGNEPVAAIEFSNKGNIVTLKPYKRLEEMALYHKFRLSQGINQIDQVLDNLSAVISSDRTFLERQAFEDIDAGVYDGCEA